MATVDSASYIESLVNKGNASASNKSDSQAMQDRFLTLLVAQISNQDPLNPMDNAQMTSQMAQINTVTGIENLNQTVKDLGSQFTSMQVLQGTSLVGREVLVEDTTLSIHQTTRDSTEEGAEEGEKETIRYANGAIDLGGTASKVKVEILNAAGAVIDTIDAGALPEGRHYFSWDATDYQGTGALSFRVVAENNGKAVEATGYARHYVQSVGMSNGLMKIDLIGAKSINYSDVQAVL
ncbi:flagellar hook capping protein FlgD [Hylemonella gracilis str. Niagara R]|uniref:Basal-body rod modification protein FlgD n=1 Tax=Hylemonella gracilis str. Niagara R TaxID=1458275 RepID=A0A016XD26_9BURK|nr:flagellar hook assembly protein FlgD [Hylemonella gracilis]EYC49989.1 flagellar hook capping protein FlgD [Hylemonella gracilis str. Niagara R]